MQLRLLYFSLQPIQRRLLGRDLLLGCSRAPLIRCQLLLIRLFCRSRRRLVLRLLLANGLTCLPP